MGPFRFTRHATTILAACLFLTIATVGLSQEAGPGVGSATVAPPAGWTPPGERLLPWEAGSPAPVERLNEPPRVDPELDLMLQQRRMLQEEIRQLEVELNNYPLESGRADLGYLRLRQSLEGLRGALGELEHDLSYRQGGGRPAPASDVWPQPPVGSRSGAPMDRRQSLLMQLREDLQVEVDSLRAQIVALRPDQAVVYERLHGRLRDLERQIRDIDQQLGQRPADRPPLRDAWPEHPATGQARAMPADMAEVPPRVPSRGPSPEVLFRVQLLRSAASDLRAAGYEQLAAQVDREMARLLDGDGPVVNDTVAAPSTGWASPMPPTEFGPEALPSHDPGLDTMRGEIDTMRQEMQNLVRQMQSLRQQLPDDAETMGAAGSVTPEQPEPRE